MARAKREPRESYFGHAGLKGHRGGSAPKDGGAGGEPAERAPRREDAVRSKLADRFEQHAAEAAELHARATDALDRFDDARSGSESARGALHDEAHEVDGLLAEHIANHRDDEDEEPEEIHSLHEYLSGHDHSYPEGSDRIGSSAAPRKGRVLTEGQIDGTVQQAEEAAGHPIDDRTREAVERLKATALDDHETFNDLAGAHKEANSAVKALQKKHDQMSAVAGKVLTSVENDDRIKQSHYDHAEDRINNHISPAEDVHGDAQDGHYAEIHDDNGEAVSHGSYGEKAAAMHELVHALTLPTLRSGLRGSTSSVQRQKREAFAESARARESDRRRRAIANDERGLLIEQPLREAAVDGGGDVLRDVVLIRSGPGNEGDGHYYPPSTLKTAVKAGLFEGAHSFMNHPTTIEEQTRPERSVSDMCGYFRNARVAPYRDPKRGDCTAIWADFVPQSGRDDILGVIRTCVAYAKEYPDKSYVGLSISARGDGETAVIDGQTYNRVDVIDKVASVDWVTRAGAGGAPIPMREAERMATTATKKRNPKITVDDKKVEAGVKALRESAKTAVLAEIGKIKIGEAAVTLTPEQDKALDAALGIVNGGAIDKIIDQATGVSDDSDMDLEGDKPSAIEENESDPTVLKKLLADERAKNARLQSGLTEAQRATERSGQSLREARADRVLTDLRIPESYAPRLRFELLERDFSESEMVDHAKAFDLAFIRRGGDGAGLTARESDSQAAKIDFTFGEG